MLLGPTMGPTRPICTSTDGRTTILLQVYLYFMKSKSAAVRLEVFPAFFVKCII
jgi:hypothetical protein